MRPKIEIGTLHKTHILAVACLSLLYLGWWFIPSHADNLILYTLLFLGEIFHVGMTLLFLHNLWPSKVKQPEIRKSYTPFVDIFITVCGEPVDVVRETAIACKNIEYKNKKIYILNDGLVAKKDNWKEIEELAKDIGIYCLTRKIPGGAKAGNINNALEQTTGEIICVFDADMVPHKDFLQKMIPFFIDKKVGFVQSPQYYKNQNKNMITSGAWQQQEFFFGPIMTGKEKSNAAFICGTNVGIRRKAFDDVGGMNEKSIAEDFLTSVQIHQKGWKSYYIPEVLAEGLAPEDLLSYYRQQHRWARGNLDLLFSKTLFFEKGLTIPQRLEYLFSTLHHINGLIVFIDILMPLIFLYLGWRPVISGTTQFAIFFAPYFFLILYTLQIASKGSLTFRAISFSQSSWPLQLSALKSVLLKQKVGFAVTPKQQQTGNFLFLVYPHLAYITLSIIGVAVASFREGMNSAVYTNIAWITFNICLFLPFINAAYPWSSLFTFKKTPQFKKSIV